MPIWQCRWSKISDEIYGCGSQMISSYSFCIFSRNMIHTHTLNDWHEDTLPIGYSSRQQKIRKWQVSWGFCLVFFCFDRQLSNIYPFNQTNGTYYSQSTWVERLRSSHVERQPLLCFVMCGLDLIEFFAIHRPIRTSRPLYSRPCHQRLCVRVLVLVLVLVGVNASLSLFYLSISSIQRSKYFSQSLWCGAHNGFCIF